MLETGHVEAELAAARKFADAIGRRAQLESKLRYLAKYASPRPTRCTLSADYAPFSFHYVMEIQLVNGVWSIWFVGNLVYRPAPEGSDVSALPTPRDAYAPMNGWTVREIRT